ncbi:MAG TPA: T9SS type A sorting domain-containing protein, partial [Saprospiraceae bacterium]|nr:T9SS type A sorting domain-containing protein [Saprospiraceae bacterium]
QYVQDVLGRGDAEDAISYLAAQPEFPYRIMSYGIMVHNLELDRAKEYLDTLSVNGEEEQDFVDVQQIYLEYITDVDSFKLSAIDSFRLAKAGEKFNPYAGYARSIFYLLTRQWIERDFEHLDSTVTQRISAVKERPAVNESVIVFPNPSDENQVSVSIGNFDPARIYRVNVYTLLGEIINTEVLTNASDQVLLGDMPGIYFLVVLKDDRIVSSKRIIHN